MNYLKKILDPPARRSMSWFMPMCYIVMMDLKIKDLVKIWKYDISNIQVVMVQDTQKKQAIKNSAL